MYVPSEKYGKPNLGKNVQIVGNANFGSEPYLIKIGDNTTISFDCAFVTHDAATRVIRNLPDGDKETVIYGPIVIGKNCFIGCRTVILPNVTIGDNVIIGAEEYADGDVFTNSIEGFWSHFRRMIAGCYHDVSDEHLQSYIDEAVYRWNTRKMSESERFANMFNKSIGLVRKWSEIRVGLIAA